MKIEKLLEYFKICDLKDKNFKHQTDTKYCKYNPYEIVFKQKSLFSNALTLEEKQEIFFKYEIEEMIKYESDKVAILFEILDNDFTTENLEDFLKNEDRTKINKNSFTYMYFNIVYEKKHFKQEYQNFFYKRAIEAKEIEPSFFATIFLYKDIGQLNKYDFSQENYLNMLEKIIYKMSNKEIKRILKIQTNEKDFDNETLIFKENDLQTFLSLYEKKLLKNISSGSETKIFKL